MTFVRYPERVCVLFSGGLDSYCMAKLMDNDTRFKDKVDLFYVKHDLPYGQTEGRAVAQLSFGGGLDVAYSVHRFTFHIFEDPKTGFIPLRNQMLVSAAVMQGYRNIAIGAVKGEESLDKSQEFFTKLSELLTYQLGEPVKVFAPYLHLSKVELVQKALNEGVVTEEDLQLTRSCYHVVGDSFVGCGACQACMRRWLTMVQLGITERYVNNPATFFLSKAHQPREWVRRLLAQPKERWPELIVENAKAYAVALRKKGAV